MTPIKTEAADEAAAIVAMGAAVLPAAEATAAAVIVTEGEVMVLAGVLAISESTAAVGVLLTSEAIAMAGVLAVSESTPAGATPTDHHAPF